jgi:hypothetical protein
VGSRGIIHLLSLSFGLLATLRVLRIMARKSGILKIQLHPPVVFCSLGQRRVSVQVIPDPVEQIILLFAMD